jgi:hypothetical protein
MFATLIDFVIRIIETLIKNIYLIVSKKKKKKDKNFHLKDKILLN